MAAPAAATDHRDRQQFQLLFAHDTESGLHYLVDTGAQVSVLPYETSGNPVSFLLAADGKHIPAWSPVSRPVVLAGRQFGLHCFVRAAVAVPILGADFFMNTGLLIDVKRRQLIPAPHGPPAVAIQLLPSTRPPAPALGLLQPPPASSLRGSTCGSCVPGRALINGLPTTTTSQLGVPCRAPRPRTSPLAAGGAKSLATAASSSPIVAATSVPPAIAKLLSEFPGVCNKDAVRFAANPAHGVKHVIETTGRPVVSRARRLDPAKLAAAKAEFAAMEKAGIIRRANGPWASPLHLVPKPDGSWRPTGDYRLLNVSTVPDRYPLPNIRDFTANLKGRCFFSKIDLVKGYYQVPMMEDDICKTAVITPFGLFEWLVMPFGVRNAANTFQRMMDRLLDGFAFAFVYLDDILIASFTFEEHLADVRAVLERLSEFGLVINPQKSLFCQSTVEFLGHTVTHSAISPLSKHVDAISAFKPPVSRKELQRFLGLLNFYRQFLPGIAAVLKPLTDALRGGPRDVFVWTAECAASFELAKTKLSVESLLFHPDPSAPISVAVDASGTHVGAVFQQRTGSAWQPLSFFSRKLSEPQQKYSAFDRELLAAFAAVRHWRYLLEGRQFTLYTDHQPLVAALHRASHPWSARQQRQLSYLSEFNLNFTHISGAANLAADCLSRPTSHTVMPTLTALTSIPACPSVDFEEMAKLQSTCPDVKQLVSTSRLTLRSFPVGSTSLLCDISTSVPRPLVPTTLRRHVFNAVHDLSHPGRRASVRLVWSKFVWKCLSKDVRLWSSQCISCQRGKVTRHVSPPIEVIPVPELPFTCVNIDIVGPFPVCSGFRYLLTMVDRTTRWPEAAPLVDMCTGTVASAFIHVWISRFGVPVSLTSDRGAQFTSSLWSELCSLLGTKHSMTTAYHPQSNGLVERFHRRLKNALRSRMVSADWLHHLPWVLLGLRTAPREESATSAAQHALGTALHVPGQFLHDEGFGVVVHQHLSGSPPLQPRHNRTVEPALMKEIRAADFVYIRSDTLARPPLAPLYSGPFEVVGKHDSHFEIKIGEKVEKINVSRLKPACLPDSAVTAAAPRRGRPPAAQPTTSPARPRPRGRPRKVPLAVQPDHSPVLPRPRGRPRKKPPEMLPTAQTSLPRPRGRPRKIKL